MAAPFQGWLYFQDADGNLFEIVNHARTLTYLRDPGITCASISIHSDVCAGYYTDPAAAFVEQIFTTPDDVANPAPWWDGIADSPTSRAYGFWIEEWTGLDGGNHGRTVASRGTRTGGGVLGPLSSKQRVMAFNMSMYGADECALDELFRWFEAQLLNLTDPCATVQAFIRTCCPPDLVPEYGVYSLEQVGLVAGPTFIDSPDGRECIVRRVSFTLVAGGACLFALPETLATDDPMDTPTIPDLCDFEDILGVTNDCTTFATERLTYPMPDVHVGIVAPIIRVANAGANSSTPFVVKGFLDPLALGADPCVREVVGTMEFDPMPPMSDMVIDCARGRILFKSALTDDEYIDGAPFFITDPSHIPSFPRFIAPGGYISIEPLRRLGDNTDLTFTVESQRRIGCMG